MGRLATRLLRLSVGLVAYLVARVTGSVPAKAHGLRAYAEFALCFGSGRAAEAAARELLAFGERHRTAWFYGNTVHYGNQVLGKVALKRADVAAAVGFLLASTETTGSPQLSSFGPNTELAAALLRNGAREDVVEYLIRCRRFWFGLSLRELEARSPSPRIDEWIDAIRSGRTPDFGPNNEY